MIQFFSPYQQWTVHEQKLYSDNTPMVKMGEGEFNAVVAGATGVLIQASSILELFTGIALVHAVNSKRDHRDRNDRIETLVLPYVPGARQDRVNPSGDNLHTLRTVGGMINLCNFKQVICADAHSNAVYSYINNLIEYPLTHIYEHLWKGYDGVIAPDKGGRVRATIAGGVLGKPTTYATKVRDVATGKLSGFEVDVERGKHYLVVDDICDGGGTFIGLIEKIKEQGAFADLFVTHGIFAKGVSPLLNAGYKNVYTTDTYPSHWDGAMRFNIVNEMRKRGKKKSRLPTQLP